MFNNAKKNGSLDRLVMDLVFGFIICQICFAIPFSLGKYCDNICIIIFSIILGYFAAKLMNSERINYIFATLKIRRTVNTYLWNDLLDKDKPMKAQLIINDIVYHGYIHLIEECSNSPHIVLAKYSINGKKNKDNNKIILLDSSKASEIIIEYNKDSLKLKEIDKFED